MDWIESLNIVASVMQVISFIPLTASAVYLFIRSRQIERRLKTLSRTLSDRPAALAIGLGQDIEKAVRQHLKDNNLELELLSLTRPGMVAPAEFSQLLADVKKLKQQLSDTGVTEVNVFYFGPVTFAAAVGAMLDNWVPIKLYNFRNGHYELDFVLSRETLIAPG